MAKRFTDSEKWKKKWFRELSPIHKCFWQYLLDSCNHAGIWEVDFYLAGVFIGRELDQKEVRDVFSKQYKILNRGSKWLIKDFIDFQYGELNPSNRAHLSVINILKKQGAYKGLASSLLGGKDKDKDNKEKTNKDSSNLDSKTVVINSKYNNNKEKLKPASAAQRKKMHHDTKKLLKTIGRKIK